LHALVLSQDIVTGAGGIHRLFLTGASPENVQTVFPLAPMV
jgi:hypothetical protein